MNIDLLGLSDIRVFEIGTVFVKDSGEVKEHVLVCLGVRTKQQGYSKKDDVPLMEAQRVLREELGVDIDAVTEKGTFEFNLQALIEKLPKPNAYDHVNASPDIAYKPFSTYPYVSRDIALWVPENLGVEAVEKVINEAAGDLRVRTTLFDTFKKGEKVSYAFRLIFQSYEKTLTDNEVNSSMENVYRAVKKEGWEVR